MNSDNTDTGIAGLCPKRKNTQPLTNFGFIPRKKSRDSTGELSMQIKNMILDPDQSAPVILDISNTDEVIEKEFNHNPKNVLGRQRTVSSNISEKRAYTNEQSTTAMVRRVVQMYPTIFSTVGSKKNELQCDFCFKIFKSAKMTQFTHV